MQNISIDSFPVTHVKNKDQDFLRIKVTNYSIVSHPISPKRLEVSFKRRARNSRRMTIRDLIQKSQNILLCRRIYFLKFFKSTWFKFNLPFIHEETLIPSWLLLRKYGDLFLQAEKGLTCNLRSHLNIGLELVPHNGFWIYWFFWQDHSVDVLRIQECGWKA